MQPKNENPSASPPQASQ